MLLKYTDLRFLNIFITSWILTEMFKQSIFRRKLISKKQKVTLTIHFVMLSA